MRSLKQLFIICFLSVFCMFYTNSSMVVDALGLPTITMDSSGQVVHGGEPIKSKTEVLNVFLSKYRGTILFLSAIGSLSMILFFILNLISLGNSKGNPQERQKAIHGLIVTGVATAGLGSVMLITQIFYNML